MQQARSQTEALGNKRHAKLWSGQPAKASTPPQPASAATLADEEMRSYFGSQSLQVRLDSRLQRLVV